MSWNDYQDVQEDGPREDGNKKTVTGRTAQRQHHNINYRIQRQQRQHETTTNSCSLTVGTCKLNVLQTKTKK